MTGKGGTIQACAACKYQRRGCSPDCALAPYFPADQPQLFQDVHRLFGVSKILRMLKQLSDDDQKDEAMKSIIYESEMRRRFPVHGCLGIIWKLKEQIKQSQEVLDHYNSLLASIPKEQRQDVLGISSSDDATCHANLNRNHHLEEAMDFSPNRASSWSLVDDVLHQDEQEDAMQMADIGSSNTKKLSFLVFKDVLAFPGILYVLRLPDDCSQNAKTIRLRSRHHKYLVADNDQQSVVQDRQGGSKHARWTVEYVEDGAGGVSLARLRSCYDKFLTATNEPFFMGVTGKKVLQTMPRRLDSSVEWEPLREGMQVKLKTRYGNYLRANGGVPPWRNSITHDIPSRSHTQDWILWEVEVLEVYEGKPEKKVDDSEDKSSRCPRSASTDSFPDSPVKNEGRVIRYNVVDDNGKVVNEETEVAEFFFKGHGVEELKEKLEEETGLIDINVCSRNPLNGKLYPLRLHLPPNNIKMHVFLVPSSSKGQFISLTWD
ncbi:hypothetical protein Ancab_006190 [Ancistrocladus abbreviatus]